MRAWMLGVLVFGLCTSSIGCQWISPRSNFERDPLVMSHLSNRSTSAKRSVGYSDEAGKSKPYESRYLNPNGNGIERASLNDSESGSVRNADWPEYKSLTGRVHYRIGRNPGWYLHFTQRNRNDKLGAAIMLADGPKLGLIREGDLVRISGEIVDTTPGDMRYRVDSVTVLSEVGN